MHQMAKYYLRDHPKQKFDDDNEWESSQTKKAKEEIQNKNFSCTGCNLIFKDKNAMQLHQAQCLTVKVDMSKQSSFFNDQFARTNPPNERQDMDKILPLSQPIGDYNYRTGEESEKNQSNTAAIDTENGNQITAVQPLDI